MVPCSGRSPKEVSMGYYPSAALFESKFGTRHGAMQGKENMVPAVFVLYAVPYMVVQWWCCQPRRGESTVDCLSSL